MADANTHTADQEVIIRLITSAKNKPATNS